MSEMKSNSIAKAWASPVFPVSGRLPTRTSVVAANYNKQTME
ncbi:hypothetical protein [Pseudomonas sp. WS 5021]|nr:hypothetical protein [Pseudomonas sp. WS 5021]